MLVIRCHVGGVEKCVLQGNRIDVLGQIRVHDELHRHRLLFVAGEVLVIKAEALDLHEVLGGRHRRDARHGLGRLVVVRHILRRQIRC